jgi:alpha-tubulin suppressor-like RCC1 family protein
MSEETLDVGETTRLLPNENTAKESQDNEVPFVLYTFGVLPEALNLCELPRALCREGIRKIACGREHFLILTEGGQVLTGGSNTFGQCGEAPSSEPVHLSEISIKRSKVRSKQFTDVAAGSYHSVLLAAQVGGLLSLGANKCYTLGHELGAGFKDKHHRHTPTEMPIDQSGLESPVAVFANYFHSALISSRDKVYTWGEQITGMKQRSIKAIDFAPEDDKPVKLAFGQRHCLMLTKKGAVYTWGDNTYGELGIAQSFVTDPVRVDIDIPAIDIAAGARHSLVLDENGALYTYGDNSEGQCGANKTRVESPTMLQTKGLIGESSIQLRYIFASDSQSGFITSTGELFAWGDNSAGKIGIPDTHSVETPAIVEPLMGRAACGFGMGGFFSVAVTGPSTSSVLTKRVNLLKSRVFGAALLKKTLNLR